MEKAERSMSGAIRVEKSEDGARISEKTELRGMGISDRSGAE